MIHVFPGEKPLRGPVILFGAMVEYCPTRDQSRLHQFGKKVPLGMLFGYAQTDRGGVNLERRNFGHMH